MSRRMKPHILWLLRFLIERGMYSPTTALPCNAPVGLSMSTLRGLGKRGYARERRSNIWEATPTGKTFADSAPKLREVPVRNTGLYNYEYVEVDRGK